MKALILFFIFSSSIVYAQKVEIRETPDQVDVRETGEPDVYSKPRTGKKAAQKYFSKGDAEESSVGRADDHYLMLGFSLYFDSDSYRWGPTHYHDPAEWALGVTYRFGEWINSTDFLIRIEYQMFDLDGSENPQKLSFVPVVIFPDARSQFPLYFGLGAGLGVFTKQLPSESRISFDYQIFLGVRFLDLLETNTGFYVESGLKNHFLLLSSGQLNSVFITFGSVFTF